MHALFNRLFYVIEKTRGAVIVPLLLGPIGWFLMQSGEPTGGGYPSLETARELVRRGQYCSALATLETPSRSENPSDTEERAALRARLLDACPLERALRTVEELLASSEEDREKLHTALQFVELLLTKTPPDLLLTYELQRRQLEVKRRLKEMRLARLRHEFWEHLRNRDWRAAEGGMAQIKQLEEPGHEYAALLERSKRHATVLQQGLTAQEQRRYEEALEIFRQIREEGPSPFVEMATKNFDQVHGALQEEQERLTQDRLPFKRTRAAAKFQRGPGTNAPAYFEVPSRTLVVSLGVVQMPREPGSWERVKLVVPHRGYLDQRIGFIRGELLVAHQ